MRARASPYVAAGLAPNRLDMPGAPEIAVPGIAPGAVPGAVLGNVPGVVPGVVPGGLRRWRSTWMRLARSDAQKITSAKT